MVVGNSTALSFFGASALSIVTASPLQPSPSGRNIPWYLVAGVGAAVALVVVAAAVVVWRLRRGPRGESAEGDDVIMDLYGDGPLN